jgi:hypothetical protein
MDFTEQAKKIVNLLHDMGRTRRTMLVRKIRHDDVIAD